MSTKLIAVMMAVALATTAAMAAFTPPTQNQINRVAAQPTLVTNLLAGANDEQAANVVESVLVAIIGLNLSAEAQRAAVMQVVAAAYATIPPAQAMAFAEALGRELRGNPIVSVAPAVVSAAQAALVTAGGSHGSALAASFGKAFIAATGGFSAKDAPPIATFYANQQQH